MKILVIGGTQFIGRHIVEAALEKGHEITLFHRGKTNPELFSEAGVERVQGDRMTDLDRLKGEWDTVIDTCGYFPRAVRISAEYLRGKVKNYVFISTISVYRDFSKKGIDESAYVKTLEEPDLEEVNPSTYGPLKTECEGVVRGIFDKNALVIRPGVVAGPYDPTDRFTYWAHRVAQGGEVLSPGRPDADVQVIDARDLATWMINCVEQEELGTFNAAGPRVSFEDMLKACKEGTGSDAKFVWVPEKFLEEVHLHEGELPLWHPSTDKRKVGLFAVNSSRARQAGLVYRPLAETARDTWQWARDIAKEHQWSTGLDLLQEQEYLRRWKDTKGQ